VVILASIVGVGLRLWLAAGSYGNYDQTSFQTVAGIMARGGNVYAETSRYNYSPVWAFILPILAGFAVRTGIAFHLAFRGFLTLVDLCNAIVIGGIASRNSGKGDRDLAVRAYLAYLLNPVAILIVGYHGQFDNLAALPLLCAVLLSLRRGSGQNASAFPLWLLATAALLVKHLNAFTVWAFFVYLYSSVKWSAIAFACSIGVFALSFWPFLPAGFDGIVNNVFLYGGIPRPYGLTTVLPRSLVYPLFFVGMTLLPLLERRRWRMVPALVFSTVALLILIPGTGEAYFILPIIWGSIVRGPGYWVYSAVTYVFLLSGPNSLQVWSGFLPWNTLWFALCFWAYWAIREAARPAQGPIETGG
jgi:hypothetical protein